MLPIAWKRTRGFPGVLQRIEGRDPDPVSSPMVQLCLSELPLHSFQQDWKFIPCHPNLIDGET